MSAEYDTNMTSAYIKEASEPMNLEHAKNVVLSPDSTDTEKFQKETDFIVSFLRQQGLVKPEHRVLDFGCGMGRVSKALIDTIGCYVVGTDISYRMLNYAEQYVADPRFVSQSEFEGQFDAALAILVLQHVENPEFEIEKLYTALTPGAPLILVNEEKRFVPSAVDRNGFVIWSDDGADIAALLKKRFTLLGRYPYYGHGRELLSVWKK